MEKEVKKKRTTKKAKEQAVKTAEVVETTAPEVAIEGVAVAEEKPKKARKPRAKKAIVEEVAAQEQAVLVEVATEEIVQSAEPVQEEKHEMTRAEKKDAVRAIVKELLTQKRLKKNALIDEASKAYVDRYPSQETLNVNDVKGRVGSVITLMEHSQEIFYIDGTMRLEKPEPKAIDEPQEKVEEPVPAPIEEAHLPVPVSEGKLAPVFDLSSLLDEKKTEKTKKSGAKKTDEKKSKSTEEPLVKDEKVEKKSSKAKAEKPVKAVETKAKPQDKLKEKFLKKIRSHGGAYLEYYAIYLLQRYAQSNGRRLEELRISGGEKDGGIDGELVLTDRFGFRETLYIQAKNWEPTDEKWLVGETLLQQFIGAVAYRMVQSGKAHGRGVYVTTSRFSEGARKMLDDMSDKFVGYDGDELFDLAKECRFGIVQKEGEWALDENLLSGEKAFFNM